MNRLMTIDEIRGVLQHAMQYDDLKVTVTYPTGYSRTFVPVAFYEEADGGESVVTSGGTVERLTSYAHAVVEIDERRAFERDRIRNDCYGQG